MASYNTGSDAANTAVRAFLTNVGEYYLNKGNDGKKRKFNTTSGEGKRIWQEIKREFNNCCAYCGKSENDCKIEIEHLEMFNKTVCGLHHPGNIVPTCKSCNKREKNKSKEEIYITWELHLEKICKKNNLSTKEYYERKEKIENHIKKYKYPQLEESEIQEIRMIANSLYENVKKELVVCLSFYEK